MVSESELSITVANTTPKNARKWLSIYKLNHDNYFAAFAISDSNIMITKM